VEQTHKASRSRSDRLPRGKHSVSSEAAPTRKSEGQCTKVPGIQRIPKQEWKISVFPTKILLATDGSPDAALAARAAIDLAGGSGSELHVVHVGRSVPAYARPPTISIEDYSFLFAQEAEALLEEQTRSIGHAGGTVAQAHLRLGQPADEILDLAEDLRVGMIVMGSRGLGPVEHLVMGSVSEEIVHHASCPVLATRGGEGSWPPASIVLGDDSSPEATEAGELAASIGRLFGAEGFLVHAYPTLPRISEEEDAFDPRIVEEAFREAEKALEERAKRLERTLARPLEVKAAVGDAAALILGIAREVEPALIAVGSWGLGVTERVRRGYTRLGSVSTKVLRAANAPVLVCPRKRTGTA
jgi:nucleotide-binding universal stress UspA family protein